MFRRAPAEHDFGDSLDDAEAVDATGHPDRQAFPGELVDRGHQAEFTSSRVRGMTRRGCEAAASNGCSIRR